MRNLLGRLHERSPRSLAAIASAWEIDLRGRDVHQDVARLFNVLTDPWSVPLKLETITPSQLRVLSTLSERDESFTGHEIAEAVGAEYDAIRDDLAALFRAGFVFAEQVEAVVDDRGIAKLFVPREIAHGLHRVAREQGLPDPEDASVDELLDRLDDAELRAVAERLGYSVIPTVARRPEIVDYLDDRLTLPERLENLDRVLTWPADALWNWLHATGRGYPTPARGSLRLSMDRFRDAIDDLARLGLIWRAYDERGRLEIVVPSAIRTPEPKPPDPPPELVTLNEPALESVVPATPYPVPWDLLTALRETQAARTQALARVLSGGAEDLSSAAARRLAGALWVDGESPPAGYLGFLGALATGLGLIDSSDPPRLTEDVRPWTRLTFDEQQQRIVQIWVNWNEWHEASGRESIQVWGADWPAFRRALLDALATLDASEWTTVASFAERFAAMQPDALGRNFTAALGREHAEDRIDRRRAGMIHAIVELTLLTAVRWLGLIEVDRARRHGYAMRLTAAGCWTLALQDDPPTIEPLGEHPISVQPDFSILLLHPGPRLIWTLSGIADLRELDLVASFEITEASVHRALDAGATVEQVARALEGYAGESLPENVTFQIREWATTYRRATLGWALVVEVSHQDDLATLETLLAEAELRAQPVDDRKLVIWTDSPDRMGSIAALVQQILRETGLTARWRPGR